MQNNIDQMIPKNIDSPKMIIDDKGKVSQKTGRVITPQPRDIIEAFNQIILDDQKQVVKLKGRMEGIAVDGCSPDKNAGNDHPMV